MTLRKFINLYRAYKKSFDLELLMKQTGTTYEKLEHENNIDDVIPL